MKRFMFKDRIVSNYVLALIFALMVPLVVSVCFMQYTVRVAVNRSEENSLLQLQQVQETVDKNLVYLRRSAIKIAQNKSLLELKSYDQNSTEDIYNTSVLATELKEEIDINDYCMGFYIYVFDADIVFYGGSKYSSREFFNTFVGDGKYDEWKSTQTGRYFDYSRDGQGKLNDMTENGVFEYLYSYPIGSNHKGVISFIIDKGIFAQESLKKQQALNSTEIYILNNQKDIIYKNGETDDDEVREFLKLSNGHTNVSGKGGKKLVCKLVSDTGGLSYIFIDNGSRAFRQINAISLFSVFYVLLVFIAGGIYVMTSARSMSRRNKEIIKHLNVKESGTDVLDWDAILKSLDELSSKKNSLEVLDSVKNNMVRNKLFVELLYGKASHVEQLKNSLKEANITFDTRDYIMVFGSCRLPDDGNTELLKFAIQNILTDLLGPNSQWYFIDYSLNQIILLLKGELPDTIKEEMTNIFDMVVEFVHGILDAELEFETGDICHSIEELRVSAQKLLNHSEYRELNSIYSEEYEGFSGSGNYVYLQKEENELMSLVLSGAADEAEMFLDRIISAHKSSKPVVLRTLFYHLVGTLLKCAEQLNMGDVVGEIEDELILYSQNSDEFETIVKRLFRTLCDRVTNSEDFGHINALGIKLMNYVDTNFKDPNLSLKTLSNEFGITVSYASKVFKERIGSNFSNYLTVKRIERAQQLLEETNLSISEIAQKTGYIDSSIFIKNFKKVVNMTPGQYRDIKNKNTQI